MIALALPDSYSKGDIQSSVYTGKTVTVPEKEVSIPGLSATGYMVISPNGDRKEFLYV